MEHGIMVAHVTLGKTVQYVGWHRLAPWAYPICTTSCPNWTSVLTSAYTITYPFVDATCSEVGPAATPERP